MPLGQLDADRCFASVINDEVALLVLDGGIRAKQEGAKGGDSRPSLVSRSQGCPTNRSRLTTQ